MNRSAWITPLLVAVCGFSAGSLWEVGAATWLVPALSIPFLMILGHARIWDEPPTTDND